MTTPQDQTQTTRAGQIRAERRAVTRRRFLTAGLALTGTAGAAAITGGLLGFGMPKTYQEAPVVEHPFTPKDPATYTAAETPPVLGPMEIAIPSIGIHAPIVDIGLEPGTNKMAIPEDSAKVGHYTPAAPIGATKGSTLIAGHVNFSDWSPGALWNLHKVEGGAHIYITDAAGKQFTYKVNSSQTILRQPLPADTYRVDGDPQLVVVTCAGTPGLDGKVRNYTDNTIITATLVSP